MTCKEIGINVALGCKIAKIGIGPEKSVSAVDLGEAALFPVNKFIGLPAKTLPKLSVNQKEFLPHLRAGTPPAG